MKDSPYKRHALWQWVLAYLFIGGILYAGLYKMYYFVAPQRPHSLYSPITPKQEVDTRPRVQLVGQNGGVGVGIVQDLQNHAIISINILGSLPSDTALSASLHAGNCAKVGKTKFILSPIVNGASVTKLKVSLRSLLEQLPMVIDVRSGKNTVSFVCGELPNNLSTELSVR